MIKSKLLFFLLIIISFKIYSQTHWVVFTDKKNTNFNPHEYFDKLAIERRINIGYNLYDSTDFPLNEKYVDEIISLVDSVSYQSRWLNALSVWSDELTINKIKLLPFVKTIIPIKNNNWQLSSSDFTDATNFAINSQETVIWNKQLTRMEGDLFRKNGVFGYGVRIAVLDAGFPNVDNHPAFEHIRKKNRIIKTWDFVRRREYVYDFNQHGTMILGAIAGIYDGKAMGLATEAEFLLARTEKESEPFSEEVNWVAAMEWADKNGAHIINSSLGYTYHRYFPNQMDGQTAFVSRIANTAASKGILVVNAAGNEGNSKWKFIIAPADADSVLTVGGIDPFTDKRISFSSFGPTADFRLKPNVVAFGNVVTAKKSGIGSVSGTSLSAPLVAGFAACAKQLFPEKDAWQLKKLIERSADLYPFFDYAHGFGVPQASNIIHNNTNSVIPSFTTELEENNIKITITHQDPIADSIIYDYNNFLYFSILNQQNIILEYGILLVHSNEFLFTKHNNYSLPSKVRFHFRKYTKDIILNK